MGSVVGVVKLVLGGVKLVLGVVILVLGCLSFSIYRLVHGREGLMAC